MNRPRILITGAQGQVGWELTRSLAALGEIKALGRQELDLADEAAMRRMISNWRPQIVVNAAAYTAVDKAEQEEALAQAINGEAPGILAEECRKIDALLVHYSTDYVFDGGKKAPWREDDATGPLSTYGRSKLAGEKAVAKAGGSHLIFRVCWVYDRRGKNFLRTILRLASERETLNVVDDQIGAPTWSRMIAEATALTLARLTPRPDPWAEKAQAVSGIYHLPSAGEVSWHGFARAIVEQAVQHPALAANLKLSPEAIRAISTRDYPTPAKRPANSLLDGSKFTATFGLALPDWRWQLARCMEEM